MRTSRRSFILDAARMSAALALTPSGLLSGPTGITGATLPHSGAPPTLNKLHLLVQTRSQDNDSSDGGLTLFSGVNPLWNIGSTPPAVGKVRYYTTDLATPVDRDTLVASALSLALDSTNKWFPRAVFLFGESAAGKVPLAVDFGNNPNKSVAGVDADFQRWPLQSLTAGGSSDAREILVLWIHTMAAGGGFTDPDTAGPLELSVFADPGSLLYHTQLRPFGLQDPANARDGHYLAVLPLKKGTGYPGDQIRRLEIANKSDDGWRPMQIELFALSAPGAGQTGRHLGGQKAFLPGSTPGYISQDPSDTAGTVKPNLSLTVPLTIGA